MKLLIIRDDTVLFGPEVLDTKEAVANVLRWFIPLRVVKLTDGYAVEFKGERLPRTYSDEWDSPDDVLYDYFKTGLNKELPGYKILKIKD